MVYVLDSNSSVHNRWWVFEPRPWRISGGVLAQYLDIFSEKIAMHSDRSFRKSLEACTGCRKMTVMYCCVIAKMVSTHLRANKCTHANTNSKSI